MYGDASASVRRWCRCLSAVNAIAFRSCVRFNCPDPPSCRSLLSLGAMRFIEDSSHCIPRYHSRLSVVKPFACSNLSVRLEETNCRACRGAADFGKFRLREPNQGTALLCAVPAPCDVIKTAKSLRFLTRCCNSPMPLFKCARKKSGRRSRSTASSVHLCFNNATNNASE
jgi:hypothetical protein